jgi:hypothetical protein
MYSVTVRIEGIESRRRSAGLLHLVIGFFMILAASNYYRYKQDIGFASLMLVLLVASFSIFYGLFRRKVDLSVRYNFHLRLLQLLTFGYLAIRMFPVAHKIDIVSLVLFMLLCLTLLFSERRIFSETTIFIDKTGIRIPGIFKEHQLGWEELNDVVIREDFITFFHKQDKYLQFQVKQDLSTLEVAKMNAFCREQLDQQNV